MATEVFVNANGWVLHSHPGEKGWGKKGRHDPAKKHEGDLHGENDAENPTNLDILTEDQKAQYFASLAGTKWTEQNRQASRARRQEAGQELCDAQCWNANPEGSCTCICGGENHGMAYEAPEATPAPAPVKADVVVVAAPAKERRTGPRELVLA